MSTLLFHALRRTDQRASFSSGVRQGQRREPLITPLTASVAGLTRNAIAAAIITGFGEAAQRVHRLYMRDRLRVLENGFDQVGASGT